MSPTHESFMAAILANPEDDAPRLVYADFLEKSGIPEHVARAEFIRLQIELARLPKKDPQWKKREARAIQLFEKHRRAWQAGFPQEAYKDQFGLCYYVRGFLQSIHTSFEAFPTIAAAVFPREPSTDVSFWNVTPETDNQIRLVAESPHLLQVHKLTAENGQLVAAALPMLRSPYLANVRYLDVPGNTFDETIFEALTSVAHLAKLQNLNIFYNNLNPAVIRMLFMSTCLKSLKYLNISHNRITSASIPDLVDSPTLTQLEALWMQGNERYERHTDSGVVVALTESSNVHNLREWDLSFNPIGDAGARAIASSPHLARLEHLDVSFCNITDEGAEAIAESSCLSAIQKLVVKDNDEMTLVGHTALENRFGDRVES